jgi:hypothetical protein
MHRKVIISIVFALGYGLFGCNTKQNKISFAGEAQGTYYAITPRWRGFAIRAFTDIFSALFIKFVFGHTAKIYIYCLIAKTVVVM